MFKKVNEEAEAIDALNISNKEKIKTGATAFVFSLLIVLGPIVMLANCFIFYDYIPYVIVGIGVCVYLLMFLTSYFYLQGITKNEVSYKYTLIGDSLLYLVIVIILHMTYYMETQCLARVS